MILFFFNVSCYFDICTYADHIKIYRFVFHAESKRAIDYLCLTIYIYIYSGLFRAFMTLCVTNSKDTFWLIFVEHDDIF